MVVINTYHKDCLAYCREITDADHFRKRRRNNEDRNGENWKKKSNVYVLPLMALITLSITPFFIIAKFKRGLRWIEGF